MKKPIDVLQDTLKELISARDHSMKSFDKGEISEELHDTHLQNLSPLIEEYKYVIRVINTYA
jgi:hypothetical protein